MITLYTTGCPKCNVLKKKLTEKGIKFAENNSVMEMLSMGMAQAPVLVVGDRRMDFSEAVAWVNEQEGEE